jgi:2-dehydropantoate 2-reductase
VRAVILGAGALGSVLAALLTADGHDVEVIAREQTAAAIAERGLRISGKAEVTVRPAVATTASGAADLLVVTVKAFDTGAALQSVRDLRPDAALSLQNGLGKDALLAEAFGPGPVLGAATMIGATRDRPGEVTYTQAGVTSIGRLDGSAGLALDAVVAAWAHAGLNVGAVDDVVSHEWAKQALQAGSAPLAALTQQPTYRLFGLGEFASVFVMTVREVDRVADAAGVSITPFDGYGFSVRALCDGSFDDAVAEVVARGQALERSGATGVMISMARDVAAGRPSELDQTTGYVLTLARQLGVETPVLTALYDITAGVERASGSRAPDTALSERKAPWNTAPWVPAAARSRPSPSAP